MSRRSGIVACLVGAIVIGLGGAARLVLTEGDWRRHATTSADGAARGQDGSTVAEPRPPRIRPTFRDLLQMSAERRVQRLRSLGELRQAAEAGEVAAQVEFGSRLAWCLGRDRESVAAYRHEQERAKAAFAAHGEQWPEEEIDEESRKMEAEALEQCALSDAEEIADYHRWLERAARSGDIDAKVAYARHALSEFTRPRQYEPAHVHDHLLANLPEVIRRRDLARGWAEDAVRAGNADILGELGSQYGGSGGLNGLYPQDALRSAIYDHAADLARAWRNPSNTGALEEYWHNGPERTDNLTDAQWDEAARQARELYLRWYGDPPD